MYYSDGTLYEGYITEGFPEKKGRKIYANGDYYLGEFQKGEFNGLGEYHQYKGVKLIGNFKNGVLNGEGKEQWPSCITYNGKFKDGKKHGRGRLEYPVENKNKKKKDKDVENPVSTEEQKTEEYYEGMFQNGEFNGKGVYVWADGRRYEGRFVNGKMNGKGVFTWKDERKYDGYYLDDVKHGLGEYSWPDGRKWKGGWKFGLQHGRGVLISKDPLDNEIVKRGIWVNGKREVWLDHLATEWPKGIDEVNLDIFDIEEEEEEEEEKEEEGLFGKIGNVFGELGDKFKSVVSNSKPDMDEYLKEYCRSYMPPLLERPDSLNSPYHGLNGVKSPNNNEGFSGFYNGKTRDPKDNIFIRNEKNNTSLNGNDKKDGSVIRQEFNNMKSKNSSVDLKNGENILPQDEKNKIIKPNDNEKKNDESLVKQKSYQMIDEKGKLVL